MTYDPELWRIELWRMPDDRIWALKAASDPSGMTPHAETTVKFLKTMELEGLLRQSDFAPVWFITDTGRAELIKLESVTNGVIEQPDLHAPGWPELRFYGRAETDGRGLWWYNELMDDGSTKKHPLQPYHYTATKGN